MNVQTNQKIDILESSLNNELDEFQSETDEDFDILQQVQEELMQEPLEAHEELPVEEAGGGRGNEAGEETQKLIPQPIPIGLDPNVTAAHKSSPLPEVPSLDPNPVYFLLAAHSNPKAPTTKASLALHVLKNLKKLVATVQAYATKSKKLAVAYVAWHSGWFGCGFGYGAPEPRHC